MRRIIALLLIVCLIFTLTGCSLNLSTLFNPNGNTNNNTANKENKDKKDKTKDNKTKENRNKDRKASKS